MTTIRIAAALAVVLALTASATANEPSERQSLAPAEPLGVACAGEPGCPSLQPTSAVAGNQQDPLAGLERGGGARLSHHVRAGEPFRAPLRIEDVALTLQMQPHSARAAGFSCQVVEAAGLTRIREPGPIPTFRGKVAEIQGSTAVGGVVGDRFEVMVLMPTGMLWLSLREDGTSMSGTASLDRTYARGTTSQALHTLPAALSRTSIQRTADRGVATCASQGLCVAEFVADTDSEYYGTFSGTSEEIEIQIQQTIETLVEMVNTRYEEEFSITHRITTCVIRPDPASDPYLECIPPPGTCSDPVGALLGKIASVWFPNPPGDVVHLFTRAGWADPGASGAAHTDGICSQNFSAGMQSYSLNTYQVTCGSAGTLMHELGHTWGSPHAENCPDIMREGGGGGNGCMSPFCPTGCSSCCTLRVDGVCVGCSRTEIEQRRDCVDQTVGCLDLLVPIFADEFESGDFTEWSCDFPNSSC